MTTQASAPPAPPISGRCWMFGESPEHNERRACVVQLLEARREHQVRIERVTSVQKQRRLHQRG